MDSIIRDVTPFGRPCETSEAWNLRKVPGCEITSEWVTVSMEEPTSSWAFSNC